MTNRSDEVASLLDAVEGFIVDLEDDEQTDAVIDAIDALDRVKDDLTEIKRILS